MNKKGVGQNQLSGILILIGVLVLGIVYVSYSNIDREAEIFSPGKVPICKFLNLPDDGREIVLPADIVSRVKVSCSCTIQSVTSLEINGEPISGEEPKFRPPFRSITDGKEIVLAPRRPLIAGRNWPQGQNTISASILPFLDFLISLKKSKF